MQQEKNEIKQTSQNTCSQRLSNLQLNKTIRNEILQLSNCVHIQNSDMGEICFVWTPGQTLRKNNIQISSFHIKINVLPTVLKIFVQPIDPIPKKYKISSQILSVIQEINKQSSANLINATILWNREQRQISAHSIMTLPNEMENGNRISGYDIREHILKGLIDQLYLVWEEMEKRSIIQIHQEQVRNNNTKSQQLIMSKILKKTKPKHHPIDLLKYHFQVKRKGRKLSTANKIDLNSNKVSTVLEYINLIEKAVKSNNYHQVKKQITISSKICPQTAQEFYEKMLNSYKMIEKQRKQIQSRQKICRGIKFLEIKNNFEKKKLNSQGSFSQTFLLSNCKYAIKISLFETSTIQALKKSPDIQQEQIKKCEPLILKTYFDSCKASKQSFEIEKNIIFLMRGESCPSIAQYYFTQIQKGISDVDQIYCQFYEKESKGILSECNSKRKVKKLLIFFKGLAEGINFLSNNGLIHRDLKPDNIRVDNKNSCRIIDFGSACPTYGSHLQQKLSLLCEVGRMTRGYFLPYHQLPDYVHSLFFPPQVFEKHKFNDLYAFGVIMQKFLGEGTLNGQQMGQEFGDKIRYLQSKCLEPNPADRLSPTEIVLYLSMMIKIWDKMCEA